MNCCFSLLPIKTLNLPHYWLASNDPNADHRMKYFENSSALGQYLIKYNVTHLLIVPGDSTASAAVDLPLQMDRMYLIRFEANTMKFTMVADVPAPY